MASQILDNPDALHALQWDIRNATKIWLATYILDREFFHELFGSFLEKNPLYLLTDYRQTPIARELVDHYPNLSARAWASNRTFHTKTIALEPLNVTYVGSHNITRGSFSMAANVMLRSAARHDYEQCRDIFLRRWQRSKPVVSTAKTLP